MRKAWGKMNKNSKSQDTSGVSRHMLNLLMPIAYFADVLYKFTTLSFENCEVPSKLKLVILCLSQRWIMPKLLSCLVQLL